MAYQWNCRRRKSISPKVKEMLVQKVLENEAYNVSRKAKGSKDQEKIVVVTKRDMLTGHVKAERNLLV